MRKKLLAALLAAALSALACGALTGCADSRTEVVVWQGKQDVAFTQRMAEQFMKENKDIKITVNTQEETDAASKLKDDPKAAADVLSVPHDQLGVLTQGDGYIFEIPATAAEHAQIAADNDASLLTTIAVNGKLMGFPVMRETYFLYYDKDVYAEEDVVSFEAMFEAAGKKNVAKAVGFDYDNGFYAGMFNLAMDDCVLFADNDSSKVTLATDLGVASAKWVQSHTGAVGELTADYTDDGEAATAMSAGNLGAWISGPWAGSALAQAVGGKEKLGYAVIPTFTVEGRAYHPKAFANIKMYVVNKQTKNVAAAMKVAAYLSCETVQKQRFEAFSYVPTHKNLAMDADVNADVVVKTVIAQFAHAVLQPTTLNMGTGWYNNAAAQTMYKAIFTNASKRYGTDEQIRAALTQIETVCKNGGTSAA